MLRMQDNLYQNKLNIISFYNRGLGDAKNLQGYKYLKSFVDRSVTRSTLKDE